ETLRRPWRALPTPLFCSTTGTYADPSVVRTAFRRICVAAQLIALRLGMEGTATPSPRFAPHGLRHTYAALHLQARDRCLLRQSPARAREHRADGIDLRSVAAAASPRGGGRARSHRRTSGGGRGARLSAVRTNREAGGDHGMLHVA